MLGPRKIKYRKPQRGRMPGKANRGVDVSFGEYGLQAQSNGWISAREIEAARRAMTRHIKRGGQVWIRIFPNKPVTTHGSENSMGSGKGSLDHFVTVVRAGRVLFEMAGVTEDLAKEAMRLAAHKLSVKTKFINKERGV
ncbi:50S ribosomal protein L16 [Patescibacteria group bacterium]|nr:50S ribosomal protein L16 [Patescibacteria group bacterium]